MEEFVTIANVVVVLLIFHLACDARELRVPVQIYRNDGNIVESHFTSSCEAALVRNGIEDAVKSYCEERSVTPEYCVALTQRALSDAPRQCALDAGVTNDGFVEYSDFGTRALARDPAAVKAEGENINVTNREAHGIALQLQREAEVLDMIYKSLDTAQSVTMRNVAFFHSCIINENSTTILREMLSTMHKARLLKELSALWILNYGRRMDQVESLFRDSFGETPRNVFWIEMYESTSLFEIPTIRILREVSSYMDTSLQLDVNVLYLHTKGVSYACDYPQLADWRSMMLFFVVERHQSCVALLDSDEFDTVGVNYLATPAQYSGNFWWATSSYLSQLPLLSLSNAIKYEAESWLLGSDRSAGVRVYNMYSSYVNHMVTRHERHQYAPAFERRKRHRR